MTLKEFVLGRRIVLRSPNPKEWVIDQIRLSVASPFSLSGYGVSGGFYFGRLLLAWGGFIPMFAIGVRPIFRGRLVEVGRDTELHATFAATWYLRLFFVWWYLFLAFTLAMFLLVAATQGVGFKDVLIMLGVQLLFGAALPGVHHLFNRKADAHFEAMLDLLAREAELVPVTTA